MSRCRFRLGGNGLERKVDEKKSELTRVEGSWPIELERRRAHRPDISNARSHASADANHPRWDEMDIIGHSPEQRASPASLPSFAALPRSAASRFRTWWAAK